MVYHSVLTKNDYTRAHAVQTTKIIYAELIRLKSLFHHSAVKINSRTR